MTDRQTRGQRNLNPLNIRKGDKWQGLAAEQTDKEFCVFESPTFGFRAACKILQKYASRGIVTIESIISRWAPPSENDTKAYIAAVCKTMKARPGDKVWPHDRTATCRLLYAMSRVESGEWPLDSIVRGYDLAQYS